MLRKDSCHARDTIFLPRFCRCCCCCFRVVPSPEKAPAAFVSDEAVTEEAAAFVVLVFAVVVVVLSVTAPKVAADGPLSSSLPSLSLPSDADDPYPANRSIYGICVILVFSLTAHYVTLALVATGPYIVGIKKKGSAFGCFV